MAKKIALGKGMASLLGGNSTVPANNVIAEKTLENIDKIEQSTREDLELKKDVEPSQISIDEIATNPNQPRKIFKEKELEELSLSIQENGIIQPLIVVKNDDGYELVAGERRLRAAKRAGLKEVPVVVKKGTDKEKMVISIIENVQRSDLNCVEEGLAYFQLMNSFNLTQEEVAKRVGKDRSVIANFLRILKLPRPVIELLQNEQLKFGHAKVLASEKERERAIRLANEAVEKELSVRELEKLMKSKRILAPREEKEIDTEFIERLDSLKQRLESTTGFHFSIKGKKSGSGQIMIKYGNEAEFNDIFEYLLKR